jgi:hypothetical protein
MPEFQAHSPPTRNIARCFCHFLARVQRNSWTVDAVKETLNLHDVTEKGCQAQKTLVAMEAWVSELPVDVSHGSNE